MAKMSGTGVENNQPKKAESVREWMGLLTGLMLVFLAAAMYGIGRAYREGYLYQLGLNLDQVPEDFYGYLYWGYYGAVRLSLGWLIGTVLGLFLLAALSFGLRRLAVKWKPVAGAITWWDEFPAQRPVGSHHKYAALAIVTVAFAYIVFVTYLVLSQAHETGVKAGDRLIGKLDASYSSGQPISTHWIELTWDDEDSKRTLAGYRLVCTQDLCSIYNPAPDGAGLLVVPLDARPEMRVLDEPPESKPVVASEPIGEVSRGQASREAQQAR